jgi:hypothetical protein
MSAQRRYDIEYRWLLIACCLLFLVVALASILRYETETVIL